MVGMVDRYLNDPQIRALVDSLEHAMETLNFTPSEVRDCAMLAAVNFEQRHARRLSGEPAQQADNSAYATTLRVVDECVKERMTLVYLCDFVQMCKQRL